MPSVVKWLTSAIDDLMVQSVAVGNLHFVWLMVKLGADPNAKYDSKSSLIHAVFRRDCRLLRFVIEAGADVNMADSFGLTPLHYAAMHGHSTMINILLTYGADPNVQDNVGWTPLHFAINSGTITGAHHLYYAMDDPLLMDIQGRTAFEVQQSSAFPALNVRLLNGRFDVFNPNASFPDWEPRMSAATIRARSLELIRSFHASPRPEDLTFDHSDPW